MKLKPIFCSMILVALNCSGAETKIELRLDKVELEELPERLGAEIEKLKQNKVLYKDTTAKVIQGYVSLVDEKKHIAEFKRIPFGRNEVLKILSEKKQFADYNKAFGFPLGQKPSYYGHLLYATWNVAFDSGNGDGVGFMSITGFFVRPKTEKAAESQLEGFILLNSGAEKKNSK